MEEKPRISEVIEDYEKDSLILKGIFHQDEIAWQRAKELAKAKGEPEPSGPEFGPEKYFQAADFRQQMPWKPCGKWQEAILFRSQWRH